MEQDGSNPIRINCVILNFNDGETVARLVHMIHDYDYLEKIVLVDNHSTDDSWEQLQVLKDEKVELIRTEKNGSLYKCGALWVGCSGAKMVGESACPASGGALFPRGKSTQKRAKTKVLAACTSQKTLCAE